MERLRILRIVFFLSITTAFSCWTNAQIPQNGLKAHWALDGNVLESVNGTNGLIHDAVPCSDRWGDAGKAYHFFSATDSIYLPPAYYVHPDSNFTLSFWFKTTRDTRTQPFNINDSGAYERNFNVLLNDMDSAVLTIWNSGGTNAISTGTPAQYSNSKWHNYLVTRRDTLLSTYIDGELKGNAIHSLPINLNKGITLSGQYYHWSGEIDEVLIYDRTFAQTGIDSIATCKYSNRIRIISPGSLEAYPVDATCKIEWQAPLFSNSLQLQYSIDNDITWINTNDPLSAQAGSYEWMIPTLPGKKCSIRLKDIQNNSVMSTSESFMISKYKWELINNNNNFLWRDGAGAYVFRDTMHLVGGWDTQDPDLYPNVTNSEVWTSLNGDNWQLKTVAPFESRHTFGTLVFNNKMWVLGGDQIQDHFQPDVWSSADGANWNIVTNNAPWGERVTHITCAFKSKMWVMGGQKVVCEGLSNTLDTVYNDVWNSADGINWTKVTDHAGWSPRAQIEGSVVFKNKMWIIGGGTYNNERKYFRDIWNTEDGVNWTLVTSEAPWLKRQYHEVIVYDNKIWVLGGWNGFSNKNDVWYSEDGINWVEQKNTPWPARHAGSVFNYHNSLYMVAGNMWNDSWRLNTLMCDTILSQPLSQTVDPSSSVTLAVSYSGTGAEYQWQKRVDGLWGNIIENDNHVGVNENVLQLIFSGEAENQEDYRCLVNGGVCSYTSEVAMLQVKGVVDLVDSDLSGSVSIYPNPSSGLITITFEEIDALNEHRVLIRDINSKLITEKELRGGRRDHHLNVGGLANGVYLIDILGKEGLIAKKKLIIVR